MFPIDVSFIQIYSMGEFSLLLIFKILICWRIILLSV